MTRLFNEPAAFTEDILDGFLDANAHHVVGVEGGVVGPGFADGAVVGNVFTSPSAREAASVARAAHGDAGVLLLCRPEAPIAVRGAG
jgi:D-erythrulose 4-kinase